MIKLLFYNAYFFALELICRFRGHVPVSSTLAQYLGIPGFSPWFSIPVVKCSRCDLVLSHTPIPIPETVDNSTKIG